MNNHKIIKEEKVLNLSKSSPNSTNPNSQPFLKEDTINSLSTNTKAKVSRNNHILNLIRQNPKITPYRLTKLCEWSYTEVCRVIRDLEYCGLITVNVVLGDGNRAHKILESIKEEKNGNA